MNFFFCVCPYPSHSLEIPVPLEFRPGGHHMRLHAGLQLSAISLSLTHTYSVCVCVCVSISRWNRCSLCLLSSLSLIYIYCWSFSSSTSFLSAPFSFSFMFPLIITLLIIFFLLLFLLQYVAIFLSPRCCSLFLSPLFFLPYFLSFFLAVPLLLFFLFYFVYLCGCIFFCPSALSTVRLNFVFLLGALLTKYRNYMGLLIFVFLLDLYFPCRCFVEKI